MSPASRSKTKDKKAGKEAQNTPVKPSVPNAVSNLPASAYNPLLGTFHTLELSQVSASSPLQNNGRFRKIDDTDEHSGAALTSVLEYDSISNNGSWSGESEDHKDKTYNSAARQEVIPGADNDKREKIRQKNERKHQRQKERRALELHERCAVYMMSRKLEALAQQLVAMGFSQEQSTMALMLNEGRVEESVVWLTEGGEEANKPRDHNLGGGNLKIDISEELARIADMETRYKCSKQEVEKAIVACEGDLDKAAESLRDLKLELPPAPPKAEEIGDPPTFSNSKLSSTAGQTLRTQTKTIPPPTIQQGRDEKDFNYMKCTVMVGGSTESIGKNVQPLKNPQPKLEWAKPQPNLVLADKTWQGAVNPSASYSLTSSPLQVSPLTKTEPHYIAVGNEFKNIHSGTVREPAISMSSFLGGGAPIRYPTNGVEVMKSSGFLPQTHTTTNPSTNDLTMKNQMYHQLQYQQQQQQLFPGNSLADSHGTNRANLSWSRTGSSPAVAAASSLGLFSGMGMGSLSSSEAASPVDWNNGGSLLHLDYMNVDWSLHDRALVSPRPDRLWQGLGSFLNNSSSIYDSNASRVNAQPTVRLMPSNLNRVSIAGLQEGGASSEISTVGSRDWTSPFEGKDLFSLPRQFVSSPL